MFRHSRSAFSIAATMLAMVAFVSLTPSPGNALWVENGTPVCTTSLQQDRPDITPDGAFGSIITWSASPHSLFTRVYAQRMDATGTAVWANQGVSVSEIDGIGGQSNAKVVAGPGNGATCSGVPKTSSA